MQIKGAIRFLAIAMTIIVVYYLSFTVISSKVRQDAEQYAIERSEDPNNPDQELMNQYLDSMKSEVVMDIGFKEYTFQETREREINLGLDLKGGMNVILEVSVEDIIKSMANHSQDTTFRKALALAKEYKKDRREDFVTLFGRAF